MRKPYNDDHGVDRNHVLGHRMDDFIHNRVAHGIRGAQTSPDWEGEQTELWRQNHPKTKMK